jgi:hypothetical protein
VIKAHEHISGRVEFTPDEKTAAYPIRDKRVGNLWIQPLDGKSLDRKFTCFDAGILRSFISRETARLWVSFVFITNSD